jgi:hypothetical protein
VSTRVESILDGFIHFRDEDHGSRLADYEAQGIGEAAGPGEARLLLYFTRKETEILMAEVLQFHLTLLRGPDPREE